MKLLFVEDDEKLSKFVITGLKQSGFTVDHASDGVDGLHLAMTESYDMVVLDIMLPGMDGLRIVEQMRKHDIDTPVIFLSAKRSTEDRIKGLYSGADDYLTKPFSYLELLARIQTLLRRTKGGKIEPTTITVGDLSIDLLARKVKRGDTTIDLQPKEFGLLQLLARNPDRVVSKTVIMEKLWDYNFDPQTNVVDVLVCRLRNKIDKPFESKMLHTLRGIGYVLKPPADS
ncbi:MAG: response regulator transcription factor [Desulfobacteraceae bacterium]|nr:response regulator transcription factor [Desulfobacteraceae bacterium]